MGASPLAFDVVTCVNQRTIDHLPASREMLWNLGVRDWRVFGIDPMGRAASNPELLLTDEQFRYLMDYIASEREAGRHVSYSCEGYLGDYVGACETISTSALLASAWRPFSSTAVFPPARASAASTIRAIYTRTRSGAFGKRSSNPTATGDG